MSFLSPHIKYSCKCNKPKVVRDCWKGIINKKKTISYERSKRTMIMHSRCSNNRQWMNDSREGRGDEGAVLGLHSLSPCFTSHNRPLLFVQELKKNKWACVDSKETESERCYIRYLLLFTGFCLKYNTLPRFIPTCTKAIVSAIRFLMSRLWYTVKEKNGPSEKCKSMQLHLKEYQSKLGIHHHNLVTGQICWKL